MIELLTELEIGNILLRLFLALVCGGLLGIERGRKKRPAGFRTYMLVCLGAALVMMTNEYISEVYNTGDPARMGAQVISGIGFLGAGTIIVTGHNRVKGLTTAAGLWAAACIGLALGIGYYSGAVIGTIMIFFAMAVMHNVDERVMSNTKVILLYIELDKTTDIGNFIKYTKENQIKINDFEIDKANTLGEIGTAVLATLQLAKKQSHTEILKEIGSIVGVQYVVEI